MALVSAINTNEKQLLASASDTDFKNSIDADRYKSFGSSLLDTLLGTWDSILGGLKNIGGMIKNMIDAVLTKIKQFLGNISGLNLGKLFDMILNVIASVLGIGGNLFDRATMKNTMKQACGGFDLGMFLKHGGDNFMLTLYALSSLLVALLCMGINAALSIITAAMGVLGFAIGGVVTIVNKTLDIVGFNPVKPILNRLTGGAFGPSTPALHQSKIDAGGLLGEIVADSSLTNAFRNTPTASKLLTGYTQSPNFKKVTDTSKYENYLDTLMPDWNLKNVSNTINAKANVISNAKSNAVNDMNGFLAKATNIGKKDFLKLL